MAQVRILLADDHPLVREGLAIAIRSRDADILLDYADSISAAESLARTNKTYALMLLDYRLPDADGFSGLFRMQHALGKTPIAIVSAYDEPQIVAAARAIGAAGFLSKSQPFDQLAQSIGELLQGKAVFPPIGTLDPMLSDLRDRLKALSPAQMRVLTALVKGHLNKQIAGDLDLSEATVKAHMTAIFRKLGVSNRVQAVLSVGPLFDLQG